MLWDSTQFRLSDSLIWQKAPTLMLGRLRNHRKYILGLPPPPPPILLFAFPFYICNRATPPLIPSLFISRPFSLKTPGFVLRDKSRQMSEYHNCNSYIFIFGVLSINWTHILLQLEYQYNLIVIVIVKLQPCRPSSISMQASPNSNASGSEPWTPPLNMHSYHEENIVVKQRKSRSSKIIISKFNKIINKKP